MKTKVVNITRTSDYDTYIGRPSRWGNPFHIGVDGSRDEVIAKYRDYVLNNPDLMDSIHELRGKKLGCWCSPLPCHGDVLAELADSQSQEHPCP